MANFLLFLFIFLTLTIKAETLIGRVFRVADGDIITVLDEAKTQHKIRLDKIDAPEKKQAYGEVSKKYLSQLVFGKEVKVLWDKKDRYGRILGEVYCGSTNVNLQMVRCGYAWHYKHYDNTPTYALAEEAASTKKLGLWQDPNPMPPYEFRKVRKSMLPQNANTIGSGL